MSKPAEQGRPYAAPDGTAADPARRSGHGLDGWIDPAVAAPSLRAEPRASAAELLVLAMYTVAFAALVVTGARAGGVLGAGVYLGAAPSGSAHALSVTTGVPAPAPVVTTVFAPGAPAAARTAGAPIRAITA